MRRYVDLSALAIGLCAILTASAPTAAQTSGSGTDKITSSSVEKKNETVAYGKSDAPAAGRRLREGGQALQRRI